MKYFLISDWYNNDVIYYDAYSERGDPICIVEMPDDYIVHDWLEDIDEYVGDKGAAAMVKAGIEPKQHHVHSSELWLRVDPLEMDNIVEIMNKQALYTKLSDFIMKNKIPLI